MGASLLGVAKSLDRFSTADVTYDMSFYLRRIKIDWLVEKQQNTLLPWGDELINRLLMHMLKLTY